MYEYFNGKLVEKFPHYVVIDVQGIGYKIPIPANLFAKLPGGRATFSFCFLGGEGNVSSSLRL